MQITRLTCLTFLAVLRQAKRLTKFDNACVKPLNCTLRECVRMDCQCLSPRLLPTTSRLHKTSLTCATAVKQIEPHLLVCLLCLFVAKMTLAWNKRNLRGSSSVSPVRLERSLACAFCRCCMGRGLRRIWW